MIQHVVDSLNSYIWSSALVIFFLIIGIFHSVATRFLQFRHLKDMVILTFKGKDSEAGLSPFKALSMSLGSRVGTGTIAGVASAIAFGGPGAVFWIWMMGILGAVTSFIEITLTQVYKSKIRGEYRGGAPFYIDKGLKMRKLAILFAVVTIIVMAVLWPTLQANTIASSVHQALASLLPSQAGCWLSYWQSLFLGESKDWERLLKQWCLQWRLVMSYYVL